MSLEQVRRIMNPRSVAIYGASDDPAKWGGGLMQILLRHGWQGEIYPINRKQETVQGRKAYADVRAIPHPVDLAVVAVPVDNVPQVIGDCADMGVQGCLVISSNFAEVGEDGARRQQALVEIARAKGTRLIGPNCMGLMNMHARFNLCSSVASQHYESLPEGVIGIASQSGALLGSMLARAAQCGIGLSSAISVGNQADLEICDFFEYLIADPGTRVVCLYIEGLKSPARFRTLCGRSIAAGKPVLLVKAGRSDAGALAVQSHTGSLAGGHDNLAAVCRQLGVVLLDDVVDMVDTAMAWASAGGCARKGVAVFTASGGGGALAVDALEAAGFTQPQLGAATRNAMARWLPPSHLELPLDAGVIASHRSPKDILQGLRESCAAIMAEPEVGAGVYYMTTQKYADDCIQALVETAKSCGKPLFLVNQASDVGQAASRSMREAGLFECTSMATAVTVLKALSFIDAALASPRGEEPAPQADPALQALLPAAGAAPVTLSEADTKALLARAGLPVPRQGFAADADEAAQVAEEIGFPVVMKIDAPGVTHKSDIGGVAVGLASTAAVREAYARIEASACQHLGPGRMRGCLVQQSVPADIELIVGARWDESFGTMLVVGIGGTLVELLHDVRILPAPFGRDEVLQQLAQLKLYPLLTGYRGAPPVDLERLAGLVVSIGRFAAGLGPRLMEFDANPVRVSGGRLCIADARAVVR